MGSHLWLFLLGLSLAFVVGQDTNRRHHDEENIDMSIPMAFNTAYNKMLPPPKFDLETEIPVKETTPPPKQNEIEFSTKIPIKLEEPTTTKIVKLNTTKTPETSKTTKLDTTYANIEEDYVYDYDSYIYDEENNEDNSTAAPSIIDAKKPDSKGELKLIKGNEMNDTEDVPAKQGHHIDDVEETEEVVFGENVPCPRECVCNRNLNDDMVATCNRLDADIQKFGNDISDLIIADQSSQFLGPEIFVKLGLKHVDSIKIVNCTIDNIHPTAFHGLNDLYSLNLTNVHLPELYPDTFATNKGLRLLAITGNDLNFMTEKYSLYRHYMLKAPSVEELDLSNSNLRELLPTAFTQVPNVIYINLAHSSLTKLPEDLFDAVESIGELDLSFNSISSLPPNIFNRTTFLTTLNLMNNEISNDLNFGIPTMRDLDLSYCSIRHIDNTMFAKMDGLVELKLKGNSIRRIQPEAFFPLSQLSFIDLSFNDLETVPAVMFFKNADLTKIKLNDNPRLRQLPLDGFQVYTERFEKLSFFDASNCAIEAIGPDTFSTMPVLVYLNMARNKIKTLDPSAFKALPSLIKLDLSNNLIDNLHDMIFHWNNELTSINLASNPITRISASLFSSHLLELDVSKCKITEFLSYTGHKIPSFYSSLRSLNASGNKIEDLSRANFKWFKKLRSFDITNNPLKCNEDFLDFMIWLGENRVVSRKVPMSASLGGSFAKVTTEADQTWGQLIHEVCKHETHLEIQPRVNGNTEMEDENEDETDEDEGEIDENENIADEIIDDDSQYDYYIDDVEDQANKDKKPIITDRGFVADEVNAIKEAQDKILRDKLLNKDEIVIERGTVYYSNYSFLWPILTLISSVIIILIVIGKIVSCIRRKRGERYRQAILASKDNFIYQKLSEEITPQTPKLHQFAPMNQV